MFAFPKTHAPLVRRSTDITRELTYLLRMRQEATAARDVVRVELHQQVVAQRRDDLGGTTWAALELRDELRTERISVAHAYHLSGARETQVLDAETDHVTTFSLSRHNESH